MKNNNTDNTEKSVAAVELEPTRVSEQEFIEKGDKTPKITRNILLNIRNGVILALILAGGVKLGQRVLPELLLPAEETVEGIQDYVDSNRILPEVKSDIIYLLDYFRSNIMNASDKNICDDHSDIQAIFTKIDNKDIFSQFMNGARNLCSNKSDYYFLYGDFNDRCFYPSDVLSIGVTYESINQLAMLYGASFHTQCGKRIKSPSAGRSELENVLISIFFSTDL